MVEDKVEPREWSLRQHFRWTELFQGFRVALDFNKLLLAAAGIIVMAFGWWLLAQIFWYRAPDLNDYTRSYPDPVVAKKEFEQDLKKWELMNEAAGPGGTLRTWPWIEDRGPNPYLLATGQARAWQAGGFWDWLLRVQLPVLFEPLVKLVMPVIYFFDSRSGPLNSFYFLLVIIWTVLTWAFFGGAITRIAVVQVARQEKITLAEAVRFTGKRLVSFLTAPIIPLILFVGIPLAIMVIYGLLHMIPWFGDILDGVLWWLMLIFGLIIAGGLIGLVGWPLMSATISAEGTDAWEAVSRSYGYVYQAPWHYLWYGVVALAYGAVLIFFVGFVASFAVYLSKWGVGLIQPEAREPEYLFVYAPESFGWRTLLLQGAQLPDGTFVVEPGEAGINQQAYEAYVNDMGVFEKVGAVMVTFWVWLFFLLVLGFGYAYFWSASSIIYLLMRKKVDDAEMDEVYLEEDDADAYAGPLSSPPPPAPAPPPSMVESPTLRAPAPAPAPPAPPPEPAPEPPPSPSETPAGRADEQPLLPEKEEPSAPPEAPEDQGTTPKEP